MSESKSKKISTLYDTIQEENKKLIQSNAELVQMTLDMQLLVDNFLEWGVSFWQ